MRRQSTVSQGVVSIAQAKLLPTRYNAMPNDILLNLAINGDQEAREERSVSVKTLMRFYVSSD